MCRTRRTKSPLWRVLPALAVLAQPACFDPDALPEMIYDVAAEDVWPTPPGPDGPAPGEGRVLVTNNLEDSLTILDLDALLAGDGDAVLDTVPLGLVPVEREGPHHVALNAALTRAYVGISNYVPGAGSGPHGIHGTGSDPGHIVEVDVATGRQLRRERVDPNPGDVRLTPDGTRILATHYDIAKITAAFADGIESGPELDSRLAILNVERFEREALVPVCPAAHGMAITADSSLVIVSCADDRAGIVDLADPDHPASVVTLLDEPGTALEPECAPYAVTLDEGDGERTAWVSCFKSGQLIAVDVDARERDGRVLQLPGKAVFGEVQEHQMIVAHQDSDGIALLDLSTPSILQLRPTLGEPCALPHYARFADDGASILLVCEGTKSEPGSLLVLDRAPPFSLRASVTLGLFPDDMAFGRRAP